MLLPEALKPPDVGAPVGAPDVRALECYYLRH